MTTQLLVKVSSTIEATSGAALLLAPQVVARLLLGAGLSDAGVAIARVAGFGLLSVAIACWPGGSEASAQSTLALFAYNLLAGLYLGYLRVGGAFAAFLLWPACALHVLLAILFARPVYERMWQARQ